MAKTGKASKVASEVASEAASLKFWLISHIKLDVFFFKCLRCLYLVFGFAFCLEMIDTTK